MRASPYPVRVGAVLLVATACVLVYLDTHSSSSATTRASASDAGTRRDASAASGLPPPIEARRRSDERPDILLITIDTVRADHASAYGYGRDTTPTLRALAARGTLFERAYAVASWTSPSIASLMTSVLPSQHGVTHLHLTPEDGVEGDRLSAELPSLPASLHEAGYHTVALTTTPLFDAASGLGRGFDDYDCLGFATRAGLDEALGQRLAALRALPGPYFLWIHVLEPRIPYMPTEPQFTRWWPASRERYPVLDTALSGVQIGATILHDHLPPHDAIEYTVAAWDSEIRAADDFVEDVLAEVDDGNLAVVVTSDHGEEFNDHHGMGHGTTLFEEAVHVPLVIAVPDQRPTVSHALVSLMDVLPTLLEIGGAAAPAGIAGQSLMPAIRGDAFAATRDIVMESGRDATVRAIFDGHYKYGERIGAEPVEGLFDLETDPYEQYLILAEHPELADAMRTRLHATIDAARARRPDTTTVALPIAGVARHQLRALGYAN